MKNILSYLWQLPQNLLGWLLRFIYKGEDAHYKTSIVRYSNKIPGGISLGKYIIVYGNASEKTIRHEYGHSIQSKYLGPFYLFIIGVPSILHAWLCKCQNHSYYDFWCEKWADKLGKVKR